MARCTLRVVNLDTLFWCAVGIFDLHIANFLNMGGSGLGAVDIRGRRFVAGGDEVDQADDDENGKDEGQKHHSQKLFRSFDRASVGFFVLIAHDDFLWKW